MSKTIYRREQLEQQLSESRREFRAADATIHNLELKLADMAAQLANANSKCAALAAENSGLKSSELEEIEVINRGGQAYCVKDGMSVSPLYARGWNDYRAKSLSVETPATDAFLAEVRAQGVEMLAEHLSGMNISASETSLREFAAQLRKGVQS